MGREKKKHKTKIEILSVSRISACCVNTAELGRSKESQARQDNNNMCECVCACACVCVRERDAHTNGATTFKPDNNQPIFLSLGLVPEQERTKAGKKGSLGKFPNWNQEGD